jgi:hypothetical protein
MYRAPKCPRHRHLRCAVLWPDNKY